MYQIYNKIFKECGNRFCIKYFKHIVGKHGRIAYNIDVNIYEIPTKYIKEAVTKMFISHTFISVKTF